jgi:hypothetical protein
MSIEGIPGLDCDYEIDVPDLDTHELPLNKYSPVNAPHLIALGIAQCDVWHTDAPGEIGNDESSTDYKGRA